MIETVVEHRNLIYNMEVKARHYIHELERETFKDVPAHSTRLLLNQSGLALNCDIDLKRITYHKTLPAFEIDLRMSYKPCSEIEASYFAIKHVTQPMNKHELFMTISIAIEKVARDIFQEFLSRVMKISGEVSKTSVQSFELHRSAELLEKHIRANHESRESQPVFDGSPDMTKLAAEGFGAW